MKQARACPLVEAVAHQGHVTGTRGSSITGMDRAALVMAQESPPQREPGGLMMALLAVLCYSGSSSVWS